MTERICGVLGCRNDATAVIRRHGDRRTVCDEHAENHEVVEQLVE